MKIIRLLLERYLILWLVLSSGLAFWCSITYLDASRVFQWSGASTMTQAIMTAMFSVGFLLPQTELSQVLNRGWSVLGGCLAQYVSMPLLAFLIARCFQLEGPLLAGVILTGVVPGAMASNILTLTARGNLSYSISLTTLSTLISPLMVPLLLLLLLGVNQGPDPRSVFWNLLLTVVAPVLSGYFAQAILQVKSRLWENLAAVLANFAILWVIAVAIGLNARILQGVTGTILSALLVINLAGYAAGWLASRLMNLPVDKRKALILEVGMQNAGVGTMLALKLFPDASTAIPTAVYTFGCMLTGTLLANYWYFRSQRTDEV